MSERDNVPEMPVGWTYEPMIGRRGFAVISCAGIGGVTLDFERRVFRGGWSFTGRTENEIKYTGRGWKSRMIYDAVKWLTGVETRHAP